MKIINVILTAGAIMSATLIFAQNPNRGEVCQDIPNLTGKQKTEINKLSQEHQKKMDQLRTEFRAGSNEKKTGDAKEKMNTERDNHYTAISKLLNTEQQAWLEQNYGGNRGRGFRAGQGFGRGQGKFCRRPGRRGTGRGSGRT